jgi:hypothetical protein
MVKNKKYQFTKGLYEKLLNWKETDPKQYWQVLNSLKKSVNSSKNPEIQVNFEKIIKHFKSQGSCKNYNVNLKNKVENHIIQYKNLLTENSIADKPYLILGYIPVVIFVTGNESIGQTKVDFYCVPWMAAFESAGIETLYFMTERAGYNSVRSQRYN